MTFDESTAFTTGSTSAKMPTIDELLSVMQKFKAKDGVRKSRSYFDILGMEPCRHCGRKAEYHEGPPEKFTLCRCMVDKLRKPCVATVAIDTLFGIALEVVEVDR